MYEFTVSTELRIASKFLTVDLRWPLRTVVVLKRRLKYSFIINDVEYYLEIKMFQTRFSLSFFLKYSLIENVFVCFVGLL